MKKQRMSKHHSSTKGRMLFFSVISALVFAGLSGCADSQGDAAGKMFSGSPRLVALADGVCQDTKTGKVWQTGRSSVIETLEEAEEYASSLNIGGYSDWRLPTVTELYSLYLTFDLHESGACSLEVEGTYWSDEPDLEGRVGAWELDDNCDAERQYIPKKKGYVRAIRP